MSLTPERVGVKHPEVCQGTLGTGPCHYRQVPGSPFCVMHGGGAQVQKNERQGLRNYILNSQYGKRAAEMLKSPGLKDLSDELVLTRVMLEGIFKQINNDGDIILFVDKIQGLVKTIQNLTEGIQKLQEKNKELLDRQTVTAITDDFLGVIMEFVTDPDQMISIADKFYAILTQRLSGPDENPSD